jgi:hypothetical protein
LNVFSNSVNKKKQSVPILKPLGALMIDRLVVAARSLSCTTSPSFFLHPIFSVLDSHNLTSDKSPENTASQHGGGNYFPLSDYHSALHQMSMVFMRPITSRKMDPSDSMPHQRYAVQCSTLYPFDYYEASASVLDPQYDRIELATTRTPHWHYLLTHPNCDFWQVSILGYYTESRQKIVASSKPHDHCGERVAFDQLDTWLEDKVLHAE